MGARVPERADAVDMAFLYGCPPLVKYPPRAASPAPASPPTNQVPPPPKAGQRRCQPPRSHQPEGAAAMKEHAHGGI